MKKTLAEKGPTTYLKRLICSGCGKNYAHNRVQTKCQTCGAPNTLWFQIVPVLEN